MSHCVRECVCSHVSWVTHGYGLLCNVQPSETQRLKTLQPWHFEKIFFLAIQEHFNREQGLEGGRWCKSHWWALRGVSPCMREEGLKVSNTPGVYDNAITRQKIWHFCCIQLVTFTLNYRGCSSGHLGPVRLDISLTIKLQFNKTATLVFH